MTRTFDSSQAAMQEVPLQIGIMGPPGGGKTLSALRLGAGIKRVRGGEIYVIDTEGGRSTKYCGQIPFKHVPFDAPYRPRDYLDAIEQQVAKGAACVVVDSMSDEHEGRGGVLDWHDEELDRMAGTDWGKRERMSQAAWIKPKRDRLRLVEGLLRIRTPIIMCFRAREKIKPLKNDKGKLEPINIGYQPIAPAEIVHTCDLTCLLPPRANGVPAWSSDKIGEDFIIKLPNFLQPFIANGHALDENMGERFARWARGGVASTAPAGPAGFSQETLPSKGEPADALIARGDAAAADGMVALGAFWTSLGRGEKHAAGGQPQLDAWKKVAADFPGDR